MNLPDFSPRAADRADQNDTVTSTAMARPSRLTIFTFLWACQALVHQEFYSGWLPQGDPRGWVLTALATATLLRPSSLMLFAGMLISSIVYNVTKWPFVVNHILLESLINVTILGAIGVTCWEQRKQFRIDHPFRERVYDRFAPVVIVMLLVMYAFAFLAKLNYDFINAEVSCVVVMYGDLLRRFPFLPDTSAAHRGAIVSTLIVEALIPLCLCFRRTRPLAITIGLPFHIVLGLVGHRTFSALAFALYAVLCMDGLVPLIATGRECLNQRTTPAIRQWLHRTAGVGIVLGIALLIGAKLTGHFETKFVGVSLYQIPWLIWIGWSIAVGAVFALALWQSLTHDRPVARTNAHPGPMWGTVPLVVLIGLSQYLGFKTETCFTMYSNLRTEGKWNNHFFMPTVRVGSWQDDLVEIVGTDHPKLRPYVEHDELITYFELRRIVSTTSADFWLEYERKGQRKRVTYTPDTEIPSRNLWSHPHMIGRLLYFRPVPTDECMPCRH